MKESPMKSPLTIFVIAATVVVGFMLTSTIAQNATPYRVQSSPFRTTSPSASAFQTRFARTQKPSEDSKLQTEVNSIVSELKKLNNPATDDDEQKTANLKKTAEDKLRAALGKRFDVLMTSREQQIEQLEKQIATLEAEVKKRRDAKEQIVDLRVQTLLNEANGLGFPGADIATRRIQTTWSLPSTNTKTTTVFNRHNTFPAPPAAAVPAVPSAPRSPAIRRNPTNKQ